MTGNHAYTTPTPEAIAEAFHEIYEDIAPDFGYATRPESRVRWDELAEPHRALMIATIRGVLIERYNLLRIAETASRLLSDIELAHTFGETFPLNVALSANALEAALLPSHAANEV